MLEAHGNKSEVRRMLEEIGAEHRAAESALTGLAYGVCRHDFITAKLNRMQKIHEDLQEIVGDEAIGMIAHRIYPTLRKKKEEIADES